MCVNELDYLEKKENELQRPKQRLKNSLEVIRDRIHHCTSNQHRYTDTRSCSAMNNYTAPNYKAVR